jgi:hypothetical protein
MASNLRSRSWTQSSSVYFFIYKSIANLNILKNQNQKRLKSNTITWTRGLAPWARERKSPCVWAFKVRLACLTCNSFFLFKGRLHFFKKKEDDKSLVMANNVSFANSKFNYYCGSWKIKPISFLLKKIHFNPKNTLKTSTVQHINLKTKNNQITKTTRIKFFIVDLNLVF